MERYREVLEKIAEAELTSAVFWIVVLSIIIAVIWVCNYFFFKKTKFRKKYSCEKQRKALRQSVWASIALSVICFGMGAISFFSAVNTISDINKDLEENTYITYAGGYYVGGDSHFSRYTLFDRWLSVDFDNGNNAFIYMDSFLEWISTEEGRFEGKVVYGKNSLIVVGIEN